MFYNLNFLAIPHTVSSTSRRCCNSARLLEYGAYPIMKPCSQCVRANYMCMVSSASSKYVDCVRIGSYCDLFLSPEEIDRWISSYNSLKERRRTVLQTIRKHRAKLKVFQEEVDQAEKKLEILDNSLEHLDDRRKEIINHKLSICDELD